MQTVDELNALLDESDRTKFTKLYDDIKTLPDEQQIRLMILLTKENVGLVQTQAFIDFCNYIVTKYPTI